MTIESYQTLLQAVLERYKSLEHPDLSFVSKIANSRPYEPLIQELKELFDIEETTDTNEDVSFCYVLSESKNKWVVELSMVGLYAVILRVAEEGLIALVATSISEQEGKIVSLLGKYKFEILQRQELEQPIALNLCNTEPEDVFMYQALFSDTDVLPWSV
jgi:hypothetical protein